MTGKEGGHHVNRGKGYGDESEDGMRMMLVFFFQ